MSNKASRKSYKPFLMFYRVRYKNLQLEGPIVTLPGELFFITHTLRAHFSKESRLCNFFCVVYIMIRILTIRFAKQTRLFDDQVISTYFLRINQTTQRERRRQKKCYIAKKSSTVVKTKRYIQQVKSNLDHQRYRLFGLSGLYFQTRIENYCCEKGMALENN